LSVFRVLADGTRIPVLGLGTWGIGGREQPDDTRDDEAISAIQMAIDLGLTHIDTAEYYGAGHCEELVGRAIQGINRRKIFITTKVWPTHLAKKDLRTSLTGSLKRLGTDYVDLLLIHWPNPEIPLRETMRTLEKCVDEGYLSHIGVSNFSPQLMNEAQSYLKERWIAVNQVEYSLVDQKPRMELLPNCRKTGVLLVAYRPLGRGILTQQGHTVLDQLAEKYGKTRSQIALNWLISQEGVITIPKSVNPLHLMEFIGAEGWSFEEDDWDYLANSFA